MPSNTGSILVLNSGSSSLKFALFNPGGIDGTAEETLAFSGSADNIGHADGHLHLRSAQGEVLLSEDHVLESQEKALNKITVALHKASIAAPVAIGHRVVHGGPHLRDHQRLTPTVLTQLHAAEQFAPLHIPQALTLISQAEKLFPGLPQFGCFDTAFHRTMPPVASNLPIPHYFADQGMIRYGFHGISYESIVFRLGSSLPSKAVFAHLGSGASLVAVENGRSIDTTMGLTPTGGIPMSTRSGDLDPGVLLYLLRTEHLNATSFENLLDHQSGLAGLSDGESDMQILLAQEAEGNSLASLAVNVFCTAVRKQIGAYAALLGGLDLLVFTGGIGEHSAPVRDRICYGLEFLGLSPASPQTRLRVLPTGEEAQIARHCRRLLQASSVS